MKAMIEKKRKFDHDIGQDFLDLMLSFQSSLGLGSFPLVLSDLFLLNLGD